MRGVLLAFLGLLLGCSSRPGPVVAEHRIARFPHDAAPHAALGCATCHDPAAVAAGEPARPGMDDHAPCDRGECHAEAFLRPPSSLCSLCHASVVPWREGETTDAAYPPRRGPRAYPAHFSHALHLDTARMDKKAGFHVGCRDCHASAATGAPTAAQIARLCICGGDAATDIALPGHETCLRCHAKQKPLMNECAACHRTKAPEPRRRRLIDGDLTFAHQEHAADVAGRPIPCVTCHAKIAGQKRTSEADAPSIGVCVVCHDDSRRTPPEAAMNVCGRCHAGSLDTFQRLVAPRSHLGERYRPDDHTLAFRRDHAREAEADSSRCARCHGGMSGQRRSNCDECHQTMRPADHLVSWREYDHGPEAAAQTDRCALCHDGESCTACHSRRPRSHAISDFAGAGHGTVAQFRLRSCLHCHTAEVECAGCHTGFSP